MRVRHCACARYACLRVHMSQLRFGSSTRSQRCHQRYRGGPPLYRRPQRPHKPTSHPSPRPLFRAFVRPHATAARRHLRPRRHAQCPSSSPAAKRLPSRARSTNGASRLWTPIPLRRAARSCVPPGRAPRRTCRRVVGARDWTRASTMHARGTAVATPARHVTRSARGATRPLRVCAPCGCNAPRGRATRVAARPGARECNGTHRVLAGAASFIRSLRATRCAPRPRIDASLRTIGEGEGGQGCRCGRGGGSCGSL